MRRTVTALFAVAIVAISGLGLLHPAVSAAADDEPHATVHVAPGGDDGSPCTAVDAPCLTVSGGVTRAHEAITDGALDVVVHVAAGTYHENVVIGAVPAGHSLSLTGAGASATTIEGLGSASVMTVGSGDVTIESLTITGGRASNGGGIDHATGTLTITDVAVTGNTVVGDSTSGGGGIYNGAATLTILRSVVSSNRSAGTGYGGGIFGLAGGDITISDSTASSNTALYYSGGIHNQGRLTVSDSTVSDNTAEGSSAGGISNDKGTLVVSGSTISGNSATGGSGKGGGIYNSGPVTITNTTLSGNSATANGGGILNRGSGAITLIHSTLAGNTSRSGAGYHRDGGTMTIEKSIISASSCSIVNVIVDGGYNVSDSCRFQVPHPTSIAGSTTIGLTPLAANGSTGPQTMAIDASSSAHHLVPGCTGTDARGLSRPGFGGTASCDAGAYEVQAVAPVVTEGPQSQSFAIGSDATFTAAASGVPTPTVQWQVNTGTAWADVPGATSTELTVAAVTRAMTGTQYRAVFTNGTATDATTAAVVLTVPVGVLDHVVLSPSTATFLAGGSQAFTAEGRDAFANSLGDVTASTVFSGTAGMTCTGATCTTLAPGSYTVTGTVGTATGTASVVVEALPAVGLPTSKPAASGRLTGVPATVEPGASFTATATGFAPYSPVTFGIYSTPVVLGTVVSDSSGTAVAQLQIPGGLVGHHTVVAAGLDPSLTARYLEMSVNIVPAAAGSAAVAVPTATAAGDPPRDQRLATTGSDGTSLGRLGATGGLLLVLGLLLTGTASRRRRNGSRVVGGIHPGTVGP